MVSNLFTGDQILAESSMKASIKLTRTQTAKAAAKSIRRKYGAISRDERYYHRGGGEWVKYTAEGFRADESRPHQPEPTRTSPKGSRVTGLQALRKGDARVGDVVYSKLIDGSYVKQKVRFVEDRGFYNMLHTVKVFKNGKLGKSVSTAAEGDFMIIK